MTHYKLKENKLCKRQRYLSLVVQQSEEMLIDREIQGVDAHVGYRAQWLPAAASGKTWMSDLAYAILIYAVYYGSGVVP